MGIWGVKIEQNDSFCEAVELFQQKIATGLQPREVYECMSKEFENEPDYHVVLFAITQCLWYCNQLTEEDIEKIKDDAILSTDAAYWADNCESNSLRQQRNSELQRFFEKLSQPPSNTDIWKHECCSSFVKPGVVFWYRAVGSIFGAVILARCAENYYLVAISEELSSVPQRVENIMEARLYTAAWFGVDNMLTERRMHLLGHVEPRGNYTGRAGLLFENGHRIICRNFGQATTWKHSFRSFSKDNAQVKDTLISSFFPKMIAPRS